MSHIWTKADDIKTLYITLYGYDKIPYSKNDIAKIIGVSNGSLGFRIGNFKAIQGIGKASNYAKLSKEVYNTYSSLKEEELRQLAFS